MKNVKVLIGNYGSGKSELALNFAIRAAARGDRTELLDLDMVNTYFRLTERDKLVEHRQYIRDNGIDLPEVRNWKWEG